MKRWLKILVVTATLCVAGFYSVRWIMSKKENTFRPYTFQTHRLSNGLKVFLVPDGRLPSLRLEFMIPGAGHCAENKDQQGLLHLLMELINKGTQKKSYTQVVEELETLGASLGYNMNTDYVSFSVQTLSWLYEPLLKLFSEIMTEPAFPEKEFQRVKQNGLDAVKRSVEHIPSYTNRIFNRYLFYPHPYGFYKEGGLKTLKSLKRGDVQDFYNKNFVPEKSVLAVSGRYPKNILSHLEKIFGKWKPSPRALTSKVSEGKKAFSFSPTGEGGVFLVDHPAALVQSEIRLGHLSVKRTHEDYMALKASSLILGGSIVSRLMDRLRTQKGLTYGIHSYFDFKKEGGAFKIAFATRNSQVGTGILETLGVVEHFYKEGVKKEELKKAKELMKTHFIRSMETVESFAHSLLYLHAQGLSLKFLENYVSYVESLNTSQVNAAIRKHLHPENLKILIVSQVDKVKSQLGDYKKIITRSYKDFL